MPQFGRIKGRTLLIVKYMKYMYLSAHVYEIMLDFLRFHMKISFFYLVVVFLYKRYIKQ